MTLSVEMRRAAGSSTRRHPRAHRSKQCVTGNDILAMAQSSCVARSVTADSALSDTIAAEPRSAQGSARTASTRVARPTEVGYVSFTPPAESRSGAHHRAISRSSDLVQGDGTVKRLSTPCSQSDCLAFACGYGPPRCRQYIRPERRCAFTPEPATIHEQRP
jgi:hypothetical protein